MHNESEPVPVLISPLMMKRALVTGEGQDLHQARLFPTTKNTITNVDTRAHLADVWEMTP